MLDTAFQDEDRDFDPSFFDDEDDVSSEGISSEEATARGIHTEGAMREAAGRVYRAYQTQYARRFRWLRPDLFAKRLKEHLLKDARALLGLMRRVGAWTPAKDAKLDALVMLIQETQRRRKGDRVQPVCRYGALPRARPPRARRWRLGCRDGLDGRPDRLRAALLAA